MTSPIASSGKLGGRPRSPLARQITAQLQMKAELFSDPLITLAEARLAIGNCSYAHARRLISDGRLRVWRSSPRGHMRVRLSELKRYLASGDQEPGMQA